MAGWGLAGGQRRWEKIVRRHGAGSCLPDALHLQRARRPLAEQPMPHGLGAYPERHRKCAFVNPAAGKVIGQFHSAIMEQDVPFVKNKTFL